MKYLFALVLLGVAVGWSYAEDQQIKIETSRSTFPIVSIPPCTEIFSDLPALAARLGVPPVTDHSAGTVLHMCDGREYPLIGLMNAFLDKIDKASKTP